MEGDVSKLNGNGWGQNCFVTALQISVFKSTFDDVIHCIFECLQVAYHPVEASGKHLENLVRFAAFS